ncbi:MAG TPA: RluA family pseudouridine synthase [Candidatus Faecousia excrementipullorum]|nr:RluA family pseudouridine synthase [Candidatus Faecousia excrementipullorum]
MQLTHVARRSGRLSSFLREEMEMSAGLMNRLKWQDKLYVNGVPQHTDYPVAPGDVITVPLEEPEPQYPAQEGSLTILYEDEHILAVDKPAGMLIHPSRSQFTDTLANFVAGYYQKTGQAAAFHPVTRLDRDTFGVVLLGKNSHTHALLSQNPLEKTYEALVYGAPTQAEGVIDAPIARRPLPSLLRQVSPEGKPSLTRYRVLSRQEKTAVLALTPVTGRTHQLRVHCAYMGFPIVGDPQYGSPESQAFSKEMGAATQLLCAKTLRFSHPITKTPMEITSTYTIP